MGLLAACFILNLKGLRGGEFALFLPPSAQSSSRIWGCIWGDTPDRTPYSPGLLSPPHFSFLGGLLSPEIGVHDDQFPDFSGLHLFWLQDSWRTPLGRLLFSAVPSGHTRVAQPPGSVVASRVPSICRVPSRSHVSCHAPPNARFDHHGARFVHHMLARLSR